MINNLIIRIFSSIILIPLSFYVIIKGDILFVCFLIICLIFSLIEWHKIIVNYLIKILGILFICLSFYSAYYLRTINTTEMYNFLFIVLVCILTDIGGYIFGNLFKGPKISKISPNKTYAGVFGGFFSSVLFLYLIMTFTNLFNTFNFIFDFKNIIYILFLSLISQIGDFIISYFKRISKIKDTGNLIPGHGGILDRIDGMIFVFPIVYVFKYLF